MHSSDLLLSTIPLFRSLPEAELARLRDIFQRVELQPGEVLFHEGDTGAHMYVIMEGRIKVIKALGTADEHLLGVRESGEYFGEMSLLDLEHRRTASVQALDPTVLLELSKAEFDGLLDRNPRVAYDMMQVLIERLNSSHNNSMRDLQEKNRQIRQAYEELKAAQVQIIEKEKLERELQVAHNIQMSILPSGVPNLSGYEFGATILPMTAVGGDFYDFIPLSQDTLGVVIGDVSGHGVPAALYMALTVALIRAAACDDCSPEKVFLSVNYQLTRLISQSMFVTALYGVLSPQTGQFTFVRAGHPLPILVDADGNVSEPPIEGSAMLGIFPDPPLATQSLILRPGDTLLFYTDGVIEAVDAGGDMFEEDRLQDALRSNRFLPAQEVCERILARVIEYTGTRAQNDDVTLLCLQARQIPARIE